MVIKNISRSAVKILLPLLIIAALVVPGGCALGSGSSAGWSGVAVADGNLYFGSTGGELVALEADSGINLWQIPFTTTGSVGLGCGASETAVAIYGTPAVDGELVYVAGNNGKIYALNTVAGASRWVYPREGNLNSFTGGPVLDQGSLYIASMGGIVYALDAENGDLIWQFEADDEIWATPAVVGDVLYIGTFNGKLYAVDTANGEAKWQQPFETDGPIVSTPLVDNGIVYAGSFDRHIYALDAVDGSLIWQFPDTEEAASQPERWFWASPVIYNDVIYAPNMDGKVYLLDAASGSFVEAIDLENAISSAPVVAQGKVFVVTEEGDFFYIDTEDNSKWEMPPLVEVSVTAPLTTDGNNVYIHSHQDEVIYAFSAESLSTLWSKPVSNE